MGKKLDLIGQKFGRLNVICEQGRHKKGGVRWLCRCDCGKERGVDGDSLRSGNTQSCGCLHVESAVRNGKVAETHGCRKNPLYMRWWNMMRRCYNPTASNYSRYGGRGISVCDRWHQVENFIADMGQPAEGQSIDRIDPNGSYCPENCQWADSKQQNRNKRNSRIVTHNGQSLPMAEWAEQRGIPYHTIKGRLKAGWPIAQALGFEPRNTEVKP